MKKEIMGSASSYNKKYYFNPAFAKLPASVQKKVQIICVGYAEKVHGIFSMGFYTDGSLFFETTGEADDFNYDEIGAPLEIEKLKRDEKDLLKALQTWYAVYKTDEGKK